MTGWRVGCMQWLGGTCVETSGLRSLTVVPICRVGSERKIRDAARALMAHQLGPQILLVLILLPKGDAGRQQVEELCRISCSSLALVRREHTTFIEPE